MGPAVGLEDLVVEVLDTERDPRHPEGLKRLHFRFGERARLALERHLLGIVPAEALVDAGDESLQLLDAQERRRAATEVDVAERAARHRRLRRRSRRFAGQRQRIPLHVTGSHVGVDAEVAELAPLPAERDVQVKTERHVGRRRREGGKCIRHGSVGPPRERRIVGDEIAAGLGDVAHAACSMRC